MHRQKEGSTQMITLSERESHRRKETLRSIETPATSLIAQLPQ